MRDTPRPLASAPGEKLRRVRGIVFDVDDTVTRDGRLERVAFDALWRGFDAGLYAVAVTGRPLGWTDVIAHQWPVHLAVGENGAGWTYRRGQTVQTGYFDPPSERRRQAGLVERIRREVSHQLPELKETQDQGARRCDLAYDIGEYRHVSPEVVQQFAELVEAEGARCVVSSVHAHAVPGAWDKAQGVIRAAHELGQDVEADPSAWMFIGDSANDAAAFSWFPVSVGVANVVDHLDRLNQPPTFITEADRGAGFAEAVNRVLSHR